MTNQNKTMLTVSFVFAIVQEAIMAFSLIFFGSSVIAQSPTLYSALNSGIINILLVLMVSLVQIFFCTKKAISQ